MELKWSIYLQKHHAEITKMRKDQALYVEE